MGLKFLSITGVLLAAKLWWSATIFALNTGWWKYCRDHFSGNKSVDSLRITIGNNGNVHTVDCQFGTDKGYDKIFFVSDFWTFCEPNYTLINLVGMSVSAWQQGQ